MNDYAAEVYPQNYRRNYSEEQLLAAITAVESGRSFRKV
jgi:hypothetical protein